MRTYGDACGITRALDLIGERWALPVVRELLLGPRRYSDLREALPGISTNILGSRLKELTEAGVVHRRRLGPPAAATVYELTAWGAQLEPIDRKSVVEGVRAEDGDSVVDEGEHA